MHRPVIEALGTAHLDHFAQIHDGDSVRHVADDRQIVRNEHIGGPPFLLQIEQQLQIADCTDTSSDESGSSHKTSPAAEERPARSRLAASLRRTFPREAVLVPRWQPHLLQGVFHAASGLAGINRAQRHQMPSQRSADRQRRIQRGFRILKHHLHRPQNAFVARQEVRRNFDAKVGRRALVGLFQTGDAPQQRALARAAFADEPHDPTARDAQRRVVDRSHRPAVPSKRLL